MSFKWRRFTFFGLCLAVPALAWAARKIGEDEASAFEMCRDRFMACKACLRLWPRHPVRLMVHLGEDHGIPSEDTIEIVEDLCQRWDKARQGRSQ